MIIDNEIIGVDDYEINIWKNTMVIIENDDNIDNIYIEMMMMLLISE